MSIHPLAKLAIKTINENKECFVAQWILQNQDKKIEDYKMCIQDYFEGNTYNYNFWMEKIVPNKGEPNGN